MNETLLDQRHKKRLTIWCVIAIMATLFATLWPFDPFPPNRVTWVPSAHGIAFGGAGLVVSKIPLPTVAMPATKTRTLELFLRPVRIESSHTILTFYVPHNPTELRIGQWTDFLLIAHDVLDSRGHAVETKVDIGRSFHLAELLLLTITFAPHATVVYVDGKRVETSAAFVVTPQELSGQIVIGTSAVDYVPWFGEIHGLAMYSKELTDKEVSQHYSAWVGGHVLKPPDLDDAIAYYAFSEGTGSVIHNAVGSAPDLEIPKSFAVLHKPMLKSVVEEFDPTWTYVDDILRNIVGFVPLGFVFCAYFLQTRGRREAILYATIAAAALSFFIEVLQAYIPQRGSGVTDIITNTLGAILGSMLARPNLIRLILPRAIGPQQQRRH